MRSIFLRPQPHSAFRDVSEVLESLEKAKTAMRVMGKYAPVDLVRRLYREKRSLSLAETDGDFDNVQRHQGVHDLFRKLTPNELADVLGLYLEALSRDYPGRNPTGLSTNISATAS